MERDIDDLQLVSVTLRASMSLLKELNSKYGPGRKYRDRSEAIRSLLQLGLRVEALMEIQGDSKKKKEFEAKFISLLKEKNIRKSLEPMDQEQLNAIGFYIEFLKEKKVQQLLDDIKQKS